MKEIMSCPTSLIFISICRELQLLLIGISEIEDSSNFEMLPLSVKTSCITYFVQPLGRLLHATSYP